jgi:putative ABC transport system permease protein
VILSAVRQALFTLRLQRLRTALTLFGIGWGTASVVFLLCWGTGVRRTLEAGFQRAGRDLAVAFAGRVGEQFTPASDRRELWLKRADVEALASKAHLVGPVGGELDGFLPVAFGPRAFTENVRGVETANLELRGVTLAQGRPISPADVDHRRRVAVLGHDVAARLLGSEGGVGSRLRIAGGSFEVIGLFERVGTQLWRDSAPIDDQIWLPITSFYPLVPQQWKAYADQEVVENLLFRFPGRRLYAASKAEVRSILAERLRVSPTDEEAIYVISPTDALGGVPLDAMQGVLFVLAVATLGIGGIGVMNMMLDSVHERRNEIGVRLAVGARRRDVVAQFLVETLAMTSVGGVLGIALGVAACAALALPDLPDLVPVPVLRADVVALAFGVMAAVGAAAGVLPAWRAARVAPAETLRAE